MAKFKKAKDTLRGRGVWGGMCWIRQEKRLAIYLRDGLACAYCGDSTEDGADLSLDHVKPHSKGGTNHETNLVTCCGRCNKSRGNRTLRSFAKGVAAYLNHGVTVKDVVDHVNDCCKRDLKPHLAEAKAMVKRRGSCAKVLASM